MIEWMNKRLIGDPTIKPETRKRIEAVQKQLDEMGTKSLHFCWDYEKMSKDLPDLDKVANELCSLLEGYFRGEYSEVPPDWEKLDPPSEVLDIMRSSFIDKEDRKEIKSKLGYSRIGLKNI